MTALDAKIIAPADCLHCTTRDSRASRWLPSPLLLISLAAALLFAVSATSFAQPAQPVAPATPATPANSALKAQPAVSPAKPIGSKPVWAELTVQQQQALRPLAPGWETISEPQKRKWLEISKNYPSLPPEGQNVMHSRMTEWVALSPQQRAQARLNFAKSKELSKELTPDEKKAKWQTYQSLSAEEKRSLAATASPKPTGAATAVKPVAPQKLTVITPAPVPRAAKASALQPHLGGDSAAVGEGLSGAASNAPNR